MEEHILNSDWVITGEGKLDEQSLMGKVVEGVSRLCREHQKKLILISGINLLSDVQVKDLGADYVYSLVELAPPDTAIAEAKPLLRRLSGTAVASAMKAT